MKGLTFGHWLKQQRKTLDLSQQALAEQAQCTVATIRKVEADKLRPSRRLAERMAEALRIAPSDRLVFQDFARRLLAETEFNPLHSGTTLQPSTPPAPPTLPIPPTPLLGRDKERAELQTLLRSPEVRLLTLTGPPGVGKTRLGLQAAADACEDFADGAIFVALAPLHDPDLVLPTIAQALHLRDVSTQPVLDTLLHALRDRQVLLLLDNFEQVAAAAPQLMVLLAHTPGLTIMVTSRVPLRVAGEHTLVVTPLALPDAQQSALAEHMMAYPAIALFVQHARTVQHTFTLEDGNAATVAEICRRLDGLPLAIELAAARVNILTPGALLRRLERRLPLLTNRAANADERHQTLRAALAWSYDRLDGEEQFLFRHLGLFVGGCSPEAVAHLLTTRARTFGAGPEKLTIPAEDVVLDRLAELVDHHLLQTSADWDGEPRFSMLETIREYALEQLAAQGELAAAQAQYAAYYSRLAAAHPLDGPDQQLWLDRLEAEHDNFRAALAWYDSEGDVIERLRLAVALGPFWHVRGYACEALGWLLRTSARYDEKPPERGQLEAEAAAAMPALCAAGFAWASHFARQQGDYSQAERLGEKALSLARPAGHAEAIALALEPLGWVAWAQGDYRIALDRLEESLNIFKALGKHARVANTLVYLAWLALCQGNHRLAAARYQEALTIGRAIGNPESVMRALQGLGHVAETQGNHQEAWHFYQDSLGYARELNDKFGIAQSLGNLGEVARAQCSYDQAATYYHKSLALLQELGAKWAVAIQLANLGHVMLCHKAIAAASSYFAESLTISQSLGRPHLESVIGLAMLARMCEQPERAARLFGAIEALLTATGTRLAPVDQQMYEHQGAKIRTQLDAATLAGAWAQGQAMTPEQVMTDALDIARSIIETVPQRPIPPQSRSSDLADLTNREIEVLRLVALGLTNAQVAQQLVVSPRTVDSHLNRIYNKLDVSSRSAAIRFAIDHALI